MLITAKEARRISESNLELISSRIRECALKGRHELELSCILKDEEIDVFKSLGYTVDYGIKDVYSDTPYGPNSISIGKKEYTRLTW